MKLIEVATSLEFLCISKAMNACYEMTNTSSVFYQFQLRLKQQKNGYPMNNVKNNNIHHHMFLLIKYTLN